MMTQLSAPLTQEIRAAFTTTFFDRFVKFSGRVDLSADESTLWCLENLLLVRMLTNILKGYFKKSKYKFDFFYFSSAGL